MSREIRFRGWLNKFKRMDYGKGEILLRDYDEIMQFTGLLDKNGKKIYEGDILRVCNKRNLIVEFLGGKFGYKDKNVDGSNMFWSLISLDDIHHEIIGNIYENPELLKQNN